ncbi:MAG: ABC transporter permease [Planctomycetia bacterium]|nr:ABC transporter permease [Planctomycetia bacterium]
MMLGPVFHRELAIAPRRSRLYVSRSVLVVLFLLLIATAWLILSGSQHVRDLGDMARFGGTLFTILAPLQLVLAMFFSAIFAAGNVSQEKDRNTLVLLLMTRMNNAELVLGKLAAAMVHLLSCFLAVAPVFFAMPVFGGVDYPQVLQCLLVTFSAILLCATLGTFLAFRQEQTFQAVSMTVLFLVVWLAVCEFFALDTFSPWRAMTRVTQSAEGGIGFPCFAFVASAVLCGWATLRVRVWNTVETERVPSEKKVEKTPAVEKERHREVWNNPVLWREIRTRAYGRRAFLVRLAYALIFFAAGFAIHQALGKMELTFYQENTDAALFALRMFLPLALLSLFLVNAQAVTAITGERDIRALDLLRVTDLSPKEILCGKLGGIFWNTREMVVLPMLFIGYLYGRGLVSLEIAAYLFGGLGVLLVFAAMLGIHSGMAYAASRSAIGVSLGTLFFLFVGVAVCLRMMLSLGGSFQAQIQPFLAFMVGGGVAMYLALGARNPSSAMALASFGCPFATFYAMTALLMNYTLGVFLVVVVTYGFTTAAMLIPAISEFDVASSDDGTPREGSGGS